MENLGRGYQLGAGHADDQLAQHVIQEIQNSVQISLRKSQDRVLLKLGEPVGLGEDVHPELLEWSKLRSGVPHAVHPPAGKDRVQILREAFVGQFPANRPAGEACNTPEVEVETRSAKGSPLEERPVVEIQVVLELLSKADLVSLDAQDCPL